MPPLIPSQIFTLVYQLGNPGDVNTYFVQAIVRYAQTGAIISTINLVNQGNQRFTGTFTVPADVSGNGYYLDITYTVYTDAMYSVLSQMYPIQNAVGQVLQQITPGIGFGGGDGISEVELRRIFELYMGKSEKPKSSKEMAAESSDRFDKEEMYERIESVRGEPVDISPILSGLEKIGGHIKSIKIPEYPKQEKTDLSPVLRMIHIVAERLASVEKISSAAHVESLAQRLEKMIEKVEYSLKQMSDANEETNKSHREMSEKALEELSDETRGILKSKFDGKFEDKKKKYDADKISSLFPKPIKSPYAKKP